MPKCSCFVLLGCVDFFKTKFYPVCNWFAHSQDTECFLRNPTGRWRLKESSVAKRKRWIKTKPMNSTKQCLKYVCRNLHALMHLNAFACLFSVQSVGVTWIRRCKGIKRSIQYLAAHVSFFVGHISEPLIFCHQEKKRMIQQNLAFEEDVIFISKADPKLCRKWTEKIPRISQWSVTFLHQRWSWSEKIETIYTPWN